MPCFRARHYSTGEPLEITIQGGRIGSVNSLSTELSELESIALPLVSPSFFDVQVNGYGGQWFSDLSLTTGHVQQIASQLARFGIGQFLPAVVTNTTCAMHHSVRTISRAIEEMPWLGQQVAGIHLEGPWISSRDGARGAHPLHAIRSPDLDEFDSLQAASNGMIKLVTVAPELPGMNRFIRELVSRGIVVAMGHTAANADEIEAAVDAGVTLATHLGNGLESRIHRHHNPLWPQLADDRLSCSLIVDGQHLPAAFVKTVIRAKTLDRVLLTCDISGWAGLPSGAYVSDWGGCDVLDSGKLVVSGQPEFLAGSHLGLGDCIATAKVLGEIPLARAVDLATLQPRKLLNLAIPELSAGGLADLTIFQEPRMLSQRSHAELPILATMSQGNVVYQAEGFQLGSA